MKVFDIALKDMLYSRRSVFFLTFGLGLPLLIAGIFYFAFGGAASEDGGFDLSTVKVQVVNQDQPGSQYNDFSAGKMLIDVLQADELVDLLEVTVVDNVAEARFAVDAQEANLAVIIPVDFTAAVFDQEGQAAIEIYHDPTLTLGPKIVKDIVTSFVDVFAGSKIAASVTQDQLAERGQTVEEDVLRGVSGGYAAWAVMLQGGEKIGRSFLFDLRTPSVAATETASSTASMPALIMAGMMVFYVFFTGAVAAQSILEEEEAGTLSRLFTTPTSRSTILSGKFLSIFTTLVIQVIVLVVVSALIFGIDWGDFWPVTLVMLALVVLAASFGIFVTSLLKNTRQTGIIYGGLMTIAGMLGMSNVFTTDVPGASKVMSTLSLVAPQGWGVRAWQALLEGGGFSEVLLPVIVMLVLGTLFFALGAFKFKKRFA